MKVFISSTFKDLAAHRQAVAEVLLRMKVQFTAMEFFGSRTDEAIPVCRTEIEQCDILIGIYAWRYGWQPAPNEPSITEQEFNYARLVHKPCLCYVVDRSYPWPPTRIDQGEAAHRLQLFKTTVSALVRSEFTTPDNLAKQVAADITRELVPPAPLDSFGSLLRINWEVFSPELQSVLSTAFAQARIESDDGVVATRHVISALADTPNTARALLVAFQDAGIQPLRQGLESPAIYELFGYDKPVSSCVLASMNKLLPMHSPAERLMAVELAVDLLKYGTGSSVADFRRAGIDAIAIDKTLAHIKQVATDKQVLRDALGQLSDPEVLHIAYVSEIFLPERDAGHVLRESILENARTYEHCLLLVGELMRRYPRLVRL